MNMRILFKKMAMLLCICVFLTGNAHVSFADDLTLAEAFFSRQEGYSGWINVPGKGAMRYYAQNDPLWAALCYEREGIESRRPFRDSGCSPSAAAMAIYQTVGEKGIEQIAAYAKQDYSLCPCSLNRIRCNKNHVRYYLTSHRDYERFLPLVLGDFATGNNIFGVYSRGGSAGTSVNYLKYVSDIYGLTLRITHRFDEACHAIKEGKGVITLAGKGGVFTNTGHYVFLAHVDEEKIYILDPLLREEYKTNYKDKLSILQPGLVALSLDQIRFAFFESYIIFE